MKFVDVAEIFRKRGYVERETNDHHSTFYEFGTMDFLTEDVVKKYDVDYKDGDVGEVTMTQFFYGTTTFKTLKTIEEIKASI